MYDPLVRHNTSEHYSPWDQLPAPEPRTVSPPIDFFYHNTAKHLIKDTVRLMANGIHINLDRVEELESVLDIQLANVTTQLALNPIIAAFQTAQHSRAVADYIADRQSKLRSVDYYLKDFNHKDLVHRSYFMHLFAQQQAIAPPSELLPGSPISKWPTNLVKTFAKTRPVLQRLIDGTLVHPLQSEAMLLLATHKCDIYNQKYRDAIQSPDVPLPAFNPASPDQKHMLLTDTLGLESDKLTKSYIEFERYLAYPQRYDQPVPRPKNKYSWDRDNIEKVNKETSDPDLVVLTQLLIDHSFAAIVRNNFIEAFYKYTVNDRLHGQYKLLGAKTGRYTSSSPNMLNMPSTKSVFAKPIKRCFTAPDGFITAAIDYSALEDRVMASLSRDTNKCNIFLQDLDGHCLNAYGYFRERVAAEMPLTGDTVIDVKQFFKLTESNKTLKEIRQEGKPATFGLSYGAYPPKVAATLKLPIEEATQIFDRYHNVLYPGITDYRENYVLPTAKEHGHIHLGLGFYINTDKPDKDIRTLNNATCQMWSLLTALTINKLHQLIDEAGYAADILVTSSIYDSIYFDVRNDPTIVKWLNDTIIPIMTTDFMQDQTIPNDAQLELGLDWASLQTLSHNATLDEITQLMETLWQ